MTKSQRKEDALARLDRLARDHQAKHPQLTYSQAYSAILRSFPKTYKLVRDGCM